MKFFIVVVLATLLAIAFAAPKQCGPNSVFNECGSACPTTCQEVVSGAEDKVCIAMCQPSCVCNEGYTLHNGNCYATGECAQLVKGQ